MSQIVSIYLQARSYYKSAIFGFQVLLDPSLENFAGLAINFGIGYIAGSSCEIALGVKAMVSAWGVNNSFNAGMKAMDEGNEIEAGDEVIETTAGHPFYVVGKGYVEAAELQVGYELLLHNGEIAAIDNIQIVHLDAPVLVYNMGIEDNHNYFVGGMGVLVHNADYSLDDSKDKLPNQGIVEGEVDGAPPVDAGKQGEHVPNHNNNTDPNKSQWPVGETGVNEVQEGWLNGIMLPDGTKVWDSGKVIGPNGETGVRVYINAKGHIHGYPVDPAQYL